MLGAPRYSLDLNKITQEIGPVIMNTYHDVIAYNPRRERLDLFKLQITNAYKIHKSEEGIGKDTSIGEMMDRASWMLEHFGGLN